MLAELRTAVVVGCRREMTPGVMKSLATALKRSEHKMLGGR